MPWNWIVLGASRTLVAMLLTPALAGVSILLYILQRLPTTLIVIGSSLVLAGTQDVVVPVDNAHYLATHIPGARLRTWDGLGHQFFVEASESFNAEVITSSIVSTARAASVRPRPARSATWPMRSCLFIPHSRALAAGLAVAYGTMTKGHFDPASQNP